MARPRIAVGMHIPPTPPVKNVKAMAMLAKLGRISPLFVWDHFQEFYPTALWEKGFTLLSGRSASPHELFEYQTLLGALSASAGRMQLGIGVTEPIRRHPVLIAQAALTLAHLTKRPPIIGLGSGERMNVDPYGLSRRSAVGRLEEALQIIRLCMESTGPVDFNGSHYRLDGAVMDLQPPAGRKPQLWVAAHGPKMLQLTGRYGDGWLPMTAALQSPEQYASGLDVIRKAAAAAGRDPNDITPALLAYVVVAPTAKEARALLQSRFLRYWGLLFPAARWQELGFEHPFGADFGGFSDVLPERYDRATLDAAIEKVPVEVLESGFLVGSPQQIAARLREFGDAGLRQAVSGPLSPAVSVKALAFCFPAMYRIARLLRASSSDASEAS
jgi:phthiodiolone/phenolphthiodiolone dimycocerosates ketoreductase